MTCHYMYSLFVIQHYNTFPYYLDKVKPSNDAVFLRWKLDSSQNLLIKLFEKLYVFEVWTIKGNCYLVSAFKVTLTFKLWLLNISLLIHYQSCMYTSSIVKNKTDKLRIDTKTYTIDSQTTFTTMTLIDIKNLNL